VVVVARQQQSRCFIVDNGLAGDQQENKTTLVIKFGYLVIHDAA
jgi:hypothetical protein